MLLYRLLNLVDMEGIKNCTNGLLLRGVSTCSYGQNTSQNYFAFTVVEQ
jgi:hypothetical protein